MKKLDISGRIRKLFEGLMVLNITLVSFSLETRYIAICE